MKDWGIADVLAGTQRWALVHGESNNLTHGLASLPEASVDHVFTDPPYAESTHAGARTGGDGSKKLVHFASFSEGAMLEAFGTFARFTKRWVVSFIDWHHVLALEAERPGGLRFIRFGVWVKANGAPQFTGDRPGQGWEAIAIMHSPEQRPRWNGGGSHAVWTVNKVNGDHPTAKPLALVEALIRDFTDPDDLIVDPFAGSGTTGVACIRLGRRFIGWERDWSFYRVAQQRLANTYEQRELVALETFQREARKKRKQTMLDLDAPFQAETEASSFHPAFLPEDE